MENKRKFIMPEPLKNALSADFICLLAKALKKHDKNFNEAGFQKAVIERTWKDKELKARIRHVSECMNEFLPYAYRKQLEIVLQAAPGFRGIGSLVFPDFVEAFGLSDVDASLEALEILTQYSTGEFAVRPLVRHSQGKVMQRVKKWAKHPNEHVRRLASEGIRPRLPWASPLHDFKKDPQPVLEILELLKSDPSEYVRRSVANNLNDIAKDHPGALLQTAKRWVGKSEETDKLLRHACRTLLKQGNPDALAIFGFSKTVAAAVKNFSAQKKKIRIGETLSFSFDVHNQSKKSQQLRIEYAVYFMKSNGKHSKKIFQLSSKQVPPGLTSFSKKHRFTDFSTRKHYPGEHILAIAVNGVEKANVKVVLTK